MIPFSMGDTHSLTVFVLSCLDVNCSLSIPPFYCLVTASLESDLPIAITVAPMSSETNAKDLPVPIGHQ
jgi:hypothetical protein